MTKREVIKLFEYITGPTSESPVFELTSWDIDLTSNFSKEFLDRNYGKIYWTPDAPNKLCGSAWNESYHNGAIEDNITEEVEIDSKQIEIVHEQIINKARIRAEIDENTVDKNSLIIRQNQRIALAIKTGIKARVERIK